MQVPVNYSNSSFLQNDDLVAVLKALQAPLSESAASCLVNSIQSESERVLSPNTPISPRSPNTVSFINNNINMHHQLQLLHLYRLYHLDHNVTPWCHQLWSIFTLSFQQQQQRIEAIQNGMHPSESKPSTPLLPQNLALPSSPGNGLFNGKSTDKGQGAWAVVGTLMV